MQEPEKLTATILDRIIEKGLRGKMSPGLVLQVKKEELEPLVIEGKSDNEIAREFEMSNASVFYLRKYYDLPGCKEARAMLACVEPDPKEEVSLNQVRERRGLDPAPILKEGIKFEKRRSPEPEPPEFTVKPWLVEEAEKQADEILRGYAQEPRYIAFADHAPSYLIGWKRTDKAKILYGIVAGVARMLKEMDGEQVEVEIVVRRA